MHMHTADIRVAYQGCYSEPIGVSTRMLAGCWGAIDFSRVIATGMADNAHRGIPGCTHQRERGRPQSEGIMLIRGIGHAGAIHS